MGLRTFMSKEARLKIQYKPERKAFNPYGQVDTIPWEPIVFEDGRFSTDDEDKIGFLLKTQAFKQGRVIEVTAEDKANISLNPPKQKTIRGAVGTTDLHTEAGFEDKAPSGLSVEEVAAHRCDFPGCNYIAENDTRGNKMRMHKLAKHGIGRKRK